MRIGPIEHPVGNLVQVLGPAELEQVSDGAYRIELQSTWIFDSVQRVGLGGGKRYLTVVLGQREIDL